MNKNTYCDYKLYLRFNWMRIKGFQRAKLPVDIAVAEFTIFGRTEFRSFRNGDSIFVGTLYSSFSCLWNS